MPRASDGSYSLPAGSLVNTGDTILVSQHNPPFQDIAQALGNSIDRDGRGGMRAPLKMGNNRLTDVAPGVAPTDAATLGQVSGLPIGAVIDYAGTTAPATFLLCFGQAVSRTEYVDLFTALGTTYGVGDGSTTFNLPDARGRVAAGKDDMGGTAASRLTTAVVGATLGANGGEQSHVLTQTEMPTHNHGGTTNTDGAHFHNLNAWSGLANVGGAAAGSTDIGSRAFQITATDGDHAHGFTTDTSGSGAAHNNVQPTLVLNKIIKAKAT